MIIVLILIFIIYSLVAFIPIEDKKIRVICFYFLGLILVFVAAFRGEGVDRDYANYVNYFQEPDFLSVEPALVIISKALKIFFSSPVSMFFVFACLGVLLKFKAIKQLSELWFLSLVIYVGYYFILHEMTQIRAGVASALLLLCIKPIYDRDWKRFLLFSLLAISFHYSAIVILPFWFLGHKPRKIWLILSIPIAYIIYFSHIDLIVLLPIPGIRDKIEVYKQLESLGDAQANAINVFNLLFLVKIAIFYFLIWKYDLIESKNKYVPILLKVYCVSLISFLIFATMQVIAFRVNELCGVVDIILIPTLFYVFKPSWFSKSIIIFIGLSLMLIILFYEKLINF
jgi:hypothetical protein